MKIEDILKKLIEANEDEVSQLYPDGRETLLNYIADLQRKEYNNSKAIEYIENNFDFQEIRTLDGIDEKSLKIKELVNILEKGE